MMGEWGSMGFWDVNQDGVVNAPSSNCIAGAKTQCFAITPLAR